MLYLQYFTYYISDYMAKENEKPQNNKQQPSKKDGANANNIPASTQATVGEKKEVIKKTTTTNPQSRLAILVGIALLIIAGIIGLALLLNSRNQPKLEDNNQPVSGAVTVEENKPDSNSTKNAEGNVDGNGASTGNTTDKNTETNSTETNNNNTSGETTNSNTNSTSENTTAPAQTSTTTSESNTSSKALKTGHSQAGYDKSLAVQKRINENGVWEATQYSKGDILAGPYTVQSGDTLWQIANGYYGDPYQWHKIEGANSSAIGYLPNGEHALIWPNQVLTLP